MLNGKVEFEGFFPIQSELFSFVYSYAKRFVIRIPNSSFSSKVDLGKSNYESVRIYESLRRIFLLLLILTPTFNIHNSAFIINNHLNTFVPSEQLRQISISFLPFKTEARKFSYGLLNQICFIEKFFSIPSL